MKDLIEIIKQIIPMIVIGAIALIGYALIQFVTVVEFVDKNGNLQWRAILASLAFIIVGYIIYRAAEKLWEK